MTYEFYNDWHIGDCLFQCLYFQRVAPTRPDDTFLLYCGYHDQIIESVEHLPNVKLLPLAEKTPQAINSWIGAGEYWHRHPYRNDMLYFYTDWFSRMVAGTDLPNPFKYRTDLWFDYPALAKPTPLTKHYDFLVVNAEPKSGQVHFDASAMNIGINALLNRGYSVIVTNPCGIPGVPCTLDHGITITGIGNISNQCDYHLMVSTGPSWGTFNALNRGKVKLRMILLNNIILQYDETCFHFRSVLNALDFLAVHKLL